MSSRCSVQRLRSVGSSASETSWASLLLAPAADQLGNVSRLGVSATGPLSDLPFGAIRAPRSLDSRGRFLVETRTLCWIDPTLDAGGTGGETDPQPVERPVALALADAVYRPPARPLGASMSDGGISWRRHAARRNQANTIDALGLPVIARFGQSASPPLFWESTDSYAVQFLHIAVEALVDPERPAGSALLLSPERYDEQAIPVSINHLASRLALEPDSLVVLSGLDTGGHGIGPGPFVEALGAAGASSVVASLWPVVDESATHLFAAFYKSVAGGRRARRRTLGKRNSGYWPTPSSSTRAKGGNPWSSTPRIRTSGPATGFTEVRRKPAVEEADSPDALG